MIQKTILQGLAIAALFVAIWFGLSQINFTKHFETEKHSHDTAEEIGDFLWEAIEKSEDVIYRDSIVSPVEKLVYHLAQENDIDKRDIKVHIIRKDEINAFAMPGGHLVVYTGLIADCENESELAGVLGHEIAHIKRNHVMKKLVKEIGLSALISMTTGGRGGAVQETIGTLASTGYDRSLESEADRTSVQYLLKADLDPEAFANFMYRMATNDQLPDQMYWLSTHPESEERAKEIVNMIKGKKYRVKAVLSPKAWEKLQDEVE
jgi:predicted Zn-dependent protease